ncbi:Serotonin N-acetyltransferase [Manis javanica]|nr:Serotonin N-acetyltransferase [Manis javanica]
MATHPGVADLPGSCALDNPQSDWFCSDNIREVPVALCLPPGPPESPSRQRRHTLPATFTSVSGICPLDLDEI